MPRKRPTPAQRRVFLVIFFGGLFAALGAVVALSRVLGAEFGQPCVPRSGFACRNDGFNDARCLSKGESAGVCTRLCTTDVDCPEGTHCGIGVWVDGPRDPGDGDREAICLGAE